MNTHNDLLGHRILFVSGYIENQLANEVISHLLLLDAEDAAVPIDLYINSPGGSLIDGMGIMDTMRCIQAPVRTFCVGQAASIAAFILACGASGERYATPNAEIMIHQVEAGIQGSAADMQLQAERVIRLQENMVQLLSGWTGKDTAQLREDMDREHFMTAVEAREFGLIDKVLEPYR